MALGTVLEVGSNGLRFEALGALRVSDGTEVGLTRPARRRMLSILLLEGGDGVAVPSLIDRMWGETPPADPRNSVHAHIAGLRQQLGDVVESTPDGYRLNLSGHWFDVDEFQRLATAAERTDVASTPGEVAEMAEAALGLWRGDPFPDLVDVAYARGKVEALLDVKRRTQVKRLDALLAAGRVEEALPELERLVSNHPYEESFWERLMLARYRIGNTAGALRAFQAVREMLGDELGIEPGVRLRSLEERILLHDPGLGMTATLPTPHNLPQSRSSFVGRTNDTDAVLDLLTEHRLVTVTGGPGLGKTRLAIEVGQRMLDTVPGGVWLARLVGAKSEEDLTATIAAAMGVVDDVADLAELGEIVAVRPQVLILDNCEHVLDHVLRFVTACLAVEAPLRVLATSRRRLGLAAEHTWRLAPLSLPSSDGVDVFESDAVRLLVDRAEAADRQFRARNSDPAQLAELCRRTDGIPLALELAASWLPSIGVADASDLVGTVAPGSTVGVDAHHRSLHAAVDWSFALLAESDRPLVAAASVFNGAFVLDAFGAVAMEGVTRAEVAGAVSRLVESSLLTVERRTDGAVRYRMLEPVREYARFRLDELGFGGEVLDRHARWHLERATALGKVIDRETDPASAQAHIDAELADHRAAMRHLLDRGDHEAAASLATALTGYWFARYLGSEAIRWLEEALSGPMGSAVRRQALWTAGWAAYSRADYASATTRYEECRSLATADGDRQWEGRALFGLGRIELPRVAEQGRAYVQQALEIFTADPELEREKGDCLIALGISAAMGGRVEEAVSVLDEAAEIMKRHGSLRSRAIIHRYLSLAAWYADDARRARHHVELSEQLARAADDRPAVGGSLIQRSLVETRWGDLRKAATAILEAVRQLPPRNEIDYCLVFVGAFGVLIEGGHYPLADRLFDHIDRVYADYGWMPVDERMPAMARIRARVNEAVETSGVWEAVPSAEMASLMTPALEEIAAG